MKKVVIYIGTLAIGFITFVTVFFGIGAAMKYAIDFNEFWCDIYTNTNIPLFVDTALTTLLANRVMERISWSTM